MKQINKTARERLRQDTRPQATEEPEEKRRKLKLDTGQGDSKRPLGNEETSPEQGGELRKRAMRESTEGCGSTLV